MILFLSNGAGEDAIASRIVSHLARLRPDLELAAFPLVGAGDAYPAGLKRYGVVATSPSGGLSNESLRMLAGDVRSGLLTRLGIQLLQLRGLRKRVERLVAVGDVLTVILGGLCGHRNRLVFVGTAKSSYHHPYSRLEQWALRRWSKQAFVRDEKTAADLRRGGVTAEWVGNPMMDGLEPLGLDLGDPKIALFPGSRKATYTELPRLLSVYAQVAAKTGASALVAVADSVDIPLLASPGWALRSGGPGPGLVGWLEHDGLPPVGLVKGALGDVLARCQIGFGQAGTAHEQAAGMGLPVVSMHPPGKPLGWYRGRQAGLLGDALWVVSPDEASGALERLLDDPIERVRRGAIGLERLGPSGGALRIAEWLAR